MTSRPLISNATDSHLLLGDGLGVRLLTMFAAGVGTLEGLKVEKLINT